MLGDDQDIRTKYINKQRARVTITFGKAFHSMMRVEKRAYSTTLSFFNVNASFLSSQPGALSVDYIEAIRLQDHEDPLPNDKEFTKPLE